MEFIPILLGFVSAILIIRACNNYEWKKVIHKVGESYISLRLHEVFIDIKRKDSKLLLKNEDYLRECITNDLTYLQKNNDKVEPLNGNCETNMVIQCLIVFLIILQDKKFRGKEKELNAFLLPFTNYGN